MYNVLIRPLIKEDALTSYQWRNDSEVWKFTGSRPNIEITQEIESEWIERILKDQKSKRFAILCNNEYVGNVQLTNIENDAAEFHIFIGNKNFWGKGVSQLATYQILYYAKEVLKLSEIYLHVKPENIAAVKSYKKNNFVVIEENSDDIKMLLQLSELKNPTVSIFVMVYNHEQFLRETVDSLLEQKTDFNYDIVIGEDYSKDNSREILLDYQKLYPGKFKLLLHNENIGASANQNITYENCKGKYIAICEGDDYWIDDMKLQKQVTFLEKNQDYSIHSSHAKTFKNGEFQDIIGNSHNKKTYEIKDFITKNNLITCTCLFKNHKVNPLILKEIYFGDWMLYVNTLITYPGSKAYISDEVYSVYRINEMGAMSQIAGIKSDEKHFIQIFKIHQLFKVKYSSEDISVINNYSLKLYRYYLSINNLKSAIDIILKNFKLVDFKIPFRKYLSYFRYRKHLKTS